MRRIRSSIRILVGTTYEDSRRDVRADYNTITLKLCMYEKSRVLSYYRVLLCA